MNISEKDAEIINSRLSGISKSVLAFDSLNTTASLDEFIFYLNNEEEIFRIETNAISDLSEDNKKFLIAKAAIQFGIIRLLSSKLDKIDMLSQNENGISMIKKANDCNWWCRNEKRIACISWSVATAGSIVLTATGCPKCVLLVLAFGQEAIQCWKYL